MPFAGQAIRFPLFCAAWPVGIALFVVLLMSASTGLGRVSILPWRPGFLAYAMNSEPAWPGRSQPGQASRFLASATLRSRVIVPSAILPRLSPASVGGLADV